MPICPSPGRQPASTPYWRCGRCFVRFHIGLPKYFSQPPDGLYRCEVPGCSRRYGCAAGGATTGRKKDSVTMWLPRRPGEIAT